MNGPVLVCDGISKKYGAREALDGVSLAVAEGRTVALFGPSGCGKSTLLGIAGGTIAPDRGRVVLAGRDVTKAPAERRGMPLVFQDVRLFPHLDVFGNVAFGLRARGERDARVREEVGAILAAVDLAGFERRPASSLSGGQAQRVALARAAVLRPRAWLLDEPFSALDAPLRQEMRALVRRLGQSFGMATLLVTHDPVDALTLADDVVVLSRGRVVDSGDARALHRKPGCVITARFYSDANLLPSDRAGRFVSVPVDAIRVEREHPPPVGPSESETRSCVVEALEHHGAHVVIRARIDGGPGGGEPGTADAGASVRIALSRNEAASIVAEPGDAIRIAWLRRDATIL